MKSQTDALALALNRVVELRGEVEVLKGLNTELLTALELIDAVAGDERIQNAACPGDRAVFVKLADTAHAAIAKTEGVAGGK